MITLAPISQNIQDTLYKKIAMLKAGGGTDIIKLTEGDDVGKWVGTNDMRVAKDSVGIKAKNNMFARSPFLRMTSFVPKRYTETQPVILMGGELKFTPSADGTRPVGSLGHGLGHGDFPRQYKWSPNMIYKGNGQIEPGLGDQQSQPLRPMPGIKDVSIEYRGGGMKLGATRTGEINWTCWTWEELDRLTPHFLAQGKSVLLEWGWNHSRGPNPKLMDIFNKLDSGIIEYDPTKLNHLVDKVPVHVQEQNGHYDAILGLVQDFEWTVNETGGFDCTTSIISRGISILQNQGRGSDTKFKKFETLPLLNMTGDNESDMKSWNQGLRDAKMMEIGSYITFKEYMSDFPSQILQKFARYDREGPTYAGATDENDYWSQQYKYFPGIRIDAVKLFQHKGNGADNFEVWCTHQLNTVGANSFIAWGWFEDNVLSRFFGQIEETKGEIISEFRSIQRVVDDVGNYRVFPLGHRKEDDPIYQSSRFRNSKFLVTVDTSKWIIPNIGDPIWMLSIDWGEGTAYRDETNEANRENIQIRAAKRTSGPDIAGLHGGTDRAMTKSQFDEFVKHLAPYTIADYEPLIDDLVPHANGPYKDTNGFKKDYSVDIEHMDIRKILFNVKYLSNMMKNSKNLSEAVLSVWDDFSNEYGGIYKFKIESDDSSHRMGLIEEGWTGVKVEKYLDNEEKKKAGNPATYPNLFVFPTMEDGSFVKGQTITAKLPDRMKVAAMYGQKAPKNSGVTEASNQTYDELVGNIWGLHHNSIASTKNTSQRDQEKKRTEDKLSGDINWPGRDNTPFGLMDANESSKLLIGKTQVQAELGIMGGEEKLHQIGDSILEDIDETEKSYIQQQYRPYDATRNKSETYSKREPTGVEAQKKWRDGFKSDFTNTFNSTISVSEKKENHGKIGQFYAIKDLNINNTTYSEWISQENSMYPGQDEEYLEWWKKNNPEDRSFTYKYEGKEEEELEKLKTQLIELKEKWGKDTRTVVLVGIEDQAQWDAYYSNTSPDFPEAGFHEGVSLNYIDTSKGGFKSNDPLNPIYPFFHPEPPYGRYNPNSLKSVMQRISALQAKAHEAFNKENEGNIIMPDILRDRNQEVNYFAKQSWYPPRENKDGTVTGTVDRAYFDYQNNKIEFVSFANREKYDWTGGLASVSNCEVNRQVFTAEGAIIFRPEVKNELIKLLRGDKDGVLQNTNVLLPLDFEMEIDGTGALFPGNSFHSSYLSTRYREESIFQMVGVNHTIDNAGWTTTVKGQIRSNAQNTQRVIDEKKKSYRVKAAKKDDWRPPDWSLKDETQELPSTEEDQLGTSQVSFAEYPLTIQDIGRILNEGGGWNSLPSKHKRWYNEVFLPNQQLAKSEIVDKDDEETTEEETVINAETCAAEDPPKAFDEENGVCMDIPENPGPNQDAIDTQFGSWIQYLVEEFLDRTKSLFESDIDQFMKTRMSTDSRFNPTGNSSDMGKLFNYYKFVWDEYWPSADDKSSQYKITYNRAASNTEADESTAAYLGRLWTPEDRMKFLQFSTNFPSGFKDGVQWYRFDEDKNLREEFK